MRTDDRPECHPLGALLDDLTNSLSSLLGIETKLEDGHFRRIDLDHESAMWPESIPNVDTKVLTGRAREYGVGLS